MLQPSYHESVIFGMQTRLRQRLRTQHSKEQPKQVPNWQLAHYLPKHSSQNWFTRAQIILSKYHDVLQKVLKVLKAASRCWHEITEDFDEKGCNMNP
jgi:hypothetical protein